MPVHMQLLSIIVLLVTPLALAAFVGANLDSAEELHGKLKQVFAKRRSRKSEPTRAAHDPSARRSKTRTSA